MSQDDFSPSERAYRHDFSVQASDIDALGHANNVVWVRWVNEAAIAHASSVGMGAAGCQELGVVWVVRRHDIAYLASAYEGEALSAVTWVHTMKGASCLRRTLFVRGERALARAETTWAMVDAASGRPTRVPGAMLAAFGFGSL